MERNADDYSGGGSGAGSAGGSTGGGYGNTGDTSGSAGYGASGSPSSSGSSFGGTSGTGTEGGMADRARDIASTAKDKLADVGSSVREGAGNAKNKLADALESGADKLRHRSGRGQLNASAGSADVSVSTDGAANVSGRVASGMQATADWLRDADLDNLREGVERQVKEHPGRSLLLAVGLGYLIGKAFRK
ncbi:MAG TPA: hypothetical protein VJN70_00260 [Gemmatimonadaceae bacterium]|nr:hypothetical protein [Gemmatimonadaceae bacterium]